MEIHATELLLKDITDSVISGGRYGLHTVDADMVLSNISKTEISGTLAALMVEAKTDDKGIRVEGKADFQIVATKFDGREYPFCKSASTETSLQLVS